MLVARPFGPEAPRPPVLCPSPQPDGAKAPEGVCAREEYPESQLAQSLGGEPPCSELGYCARAEVVRLLIARSYAEDERSSDAARQTW